MSEAESEIARKLSEVEVLLRSLLDCGLPFVENNAAGALPFVRDCLDALGVDIPEEGPRIT
jgi:hypothetical protein